jgi:hypothetical protein
MKKSKRFAPATLPAKTQQQSPSVYMPLESVPILNYVPLKLHPRICHSSNSLSLHQGIRGFILVSKPFYAVLILKIRGKANLAKGATFFAAADSRV